MTVSLMPQEIQSILDLICDQGFEDTFNTLSDREKDLTRSVVGSDVVDFIALDDSGYAWHFISNEQTGEWDVQPVGFPRYEIDAAMIGGDEIDVEEFASEVQHNLPGVEVIAITSSINGSGNHASEFWQAFQSELDRAFSVAMESFE